MHALTRRVLSASRSSLSSQSRGLPTKSYARGPFEPPLLTQTIGNHFAGIVSTFGDRPAVISRHQNARLSYHDLDSDSNRLAHGLVQRGVKRADRVAVSLGNGVEFAVVPLNPAFSAQQIISALSHLEASLLVIGSQTALPYQKFKSNIPNLREIVPDLESQKLECPLLQSLSQIIVVDTHAEPQDPPLDSLNATTPYQDVLHDQDFSGAYRDESLRPDDIINIQFTSGTTSTPKAACLTHRSILNNGKSIGDRMLLTDRDIVCCPPPLFHCFGSVLGYMASATHGSCIVFPSAAFDPRATLAAVSDEHCTALYGVPTMFIAELDLIRQYKEDGSSMEGVAEQSLDFSSLRTGIAAGSSVPAELMRKLHQTLNLTQLTICYGMTETSPVSCMTTTDDPLEKRLDSVGRLLPHVEAKIVSMTAEETGHEPLDGSESSRGRSVVPIGQRGELAISGYLVMQGYWRDEARTSEVLISDDDDDDDDDDDNKDVENSSTIASTPTPTPPNPSSPPASQPSHPRKIWMYTGDEAIMDPEGYIKITGRIKDVIIRGGENIHPLEIENVLLSHPEVVEVSVVGIPDAKLGEVVGVFVVVRKGKMGMGMGEAEEGKEETGTSKREDLRDWVRQKLSRHLIPKYVFFVEGFPKTASGKIQKFRLRDEAVRRIRGDGEDGEGS